MAPGFPENADSHARNGEQDCEHVCNGVVWTKAFEREGAAATGESGQGEAPARNGIEEIEKHLEDELE